MKTLLLIRHAKSSWSDPNLRDFDRPLNGRGARNAPMMGQRLRRYGLVPELIVSSPARRAMDTATAMVEVWGLDGGEIVLEPRLYHASGLEILDIARNTPEAVSRVAIFGHNPGMQEALERLCGRRIDKFRTAAIACLKTPSAWSDLDWGQASLEFLDDPRRPERSA